MSFDRIARHYRWLETAAFGSILQMARTRWIEKIAEAKRVLILGEGNGRFLCELLCAYPKAAVDCVDASARMLDLAHGRVLKVLPQALSGVRFLREDIVSWSPSGSYDLLVLAQAATPDAYLFLSDFCVSRKYFSRVHAKIWLAVMYRFFRATTGIRAKRLADPTNELGANGFVCLSRSHWRLGLVKSELWQRRDDSIQAGTVSKGAIFG